MKIPLKISSVLIVVPIFMAISVHISAGEWYEGGDLHSKSINEWNNSTYQNRLATSGDWFVRITKKFNPSLKRKIDSLPDTRYLNTLRNFATELETCVSEITKDKRATNPNDRVAELASLCYITMYGTE